MKKRFLFLTVCSAVLNFTTSILMQGQSAFSASLTPTPLIIDDDGSQDGLAALAYLLTSPKFDIKAITMSHGVARPENPGFQTGLKRMMGYLDITDIPVGIGRSLPLEGTNAFPAFIRNDADKFYAPFVTLPEEVPEIEFKSAAQLIVDTIKNSPEPVAIFSAGSMTNIAEALRIDPTIISNIAVLQIMGGAIYTPGNLGVIPEPPFSTNMVAEFNIWLDPVASKEVFDAGNNGLKIQLTPLDATNKIAFTRADYQAWLAAGTPESTLAAQLLDFSLVVVGGDVNPNPLWDMVAAINLNEPDFSPETPLALEVDVASAPGDTQGQLRVIPNSPPNVLVSFDPSFNNLSFKSTELFFSQSAAVPEPATMLGALTAAGVLLARRRKQPDRK
ncbi:MAG: nucleoside hydrolase [Oscillatoriales cyanobacterium C42_A2020_001]|nr:nucleoside hydrolase [Leptolyngbyaceae cyanobacterium C42_A2020_001]